MSYLKELVNSQSMLFQLVKNDFKAKYLGSYLGMFWAFINPIITILVFWIVFQFGFRSMPVGDYPYVVWLISGIIVWFFFSESLGSGTHSIVDNSFLVKKVSFRVSYLPVIKILSGLIIHLFFIIAAFIIVWSYGYEPTLHLLQVFYYLISVIILLLGLTWLTSSIYVFFRDTSQIISIIISLGFWLTPVFWTFSMVPEKYQIFFRINPMIYIVEGYRSSFLYHQWFWEDIPSLIMFWGEVAVIFLLGVFVFKRLRTQFSDVI
ncbi:ABC transporter permease [Paenibacillus tarimensis]|uniref:ABC transporter permease n=1 Tax=Paenibacillus tarimensis TaxID=416012 RepID=UPI001F30AC96|nr:ABC transporter permease [Paenibacillus tarimensis]MCF2945892.1 ABC transporter permease [Paenibacillus tarimensis]